MSEAKSGKTASVAILSADVASLIRATILCKPLPHDARRKPRLAPRRLDVLLQEAVRFLAGIAGPGIGPGAAFVVGGAGGLAGVVAAGTVEIGLRQRRALAYGRRQKGERHPTRPEQANSPHLRVAFEYAFPARDGFPSKSRPAPAL